MCDKISSGFSHTSSVTIIIHLCFGIRIANLKLFKHLGAFPSLDYVQVYTHILLYLMVPNKMHIYAYQIHMRMMKRGIVVE